MVSYARQMALAALAVLLVAACSGSGSGESSGATEATGNPVVVLSTTLGDIKIELYPDKAPKTVENFLRYVNEGKYDGTIFHRVIKRFMNQGGGFTPDYKKVGTFAPIKNEADNGLLNKRGSIAMARTPDPDSASSQFFINLKDNDFLNYSAPTAQGWGYAVLGEVVEGMDVVDSIAALETDKYNRPLKNVRIIKASVIKE